MVVHHDRLKPCEDSTFPLWLQRQRHKLLKTLPIEEMEDSDREPGLDELDVPPDVELLFDPDETLPYMLGDDPELLEDDNQFDYSPQFENKIPTDIISQDLGDLESDPDTGDQFEPSIQPRTTRTGRKIHLPARFKD